MDRFMIRFVTKVVGSSDDVAGLLAGGLAGRAGGDLGGRSVLVFVQSIAGGEATSYLAYARTSNARFH